MEVTYENVTVKDAFPAEARSCSLGHAPIMIQMSRSSAQPENTATFISLESQTPQRKLLNSSQNKPKLDRYESLQKS